MSSQENATNSDVGRAAARYSSGFADREPYLIRARRIAKLTLPYLYRVVGANATTDDELPWQSLGAECVKGLSNKIVTALFGGQFMHLEESSETKTHYQGMDPDARSALELAIAKGLAKVERDFLKEMTKDGDKPKLSQAARGLVLAGNHCLHHTTGGLQSLKLERYCTWRDRMGNLLEFAIQEPMSYRSLPEDVQKIVRDLGYGPRETEDGDMHPEAWSTLDNPIWSPLNVYTYGDRVNGKWFVCDEIMGREVPGSSARYASDDKLPWQFLRMVEQDGEPYGRSYVEDYEADLQSFDGMWQALIEGGASIAQLKWLVRPGGVTSKKAFAEAANGEVLTGDKDDVFAVKADKGGDLEVLWQQAEAVAERLQKGFCVWGGARDAERVTKEEIQQDIAQLSAALGDVYFTQEVTWQTPYAKLKLASLIKQKRLPPIPEGAVDVTVLAGADALKRADEANELESYLQTWAEIAPEDFAKNVNITTGMTRSAINRGIDPDGLLYTPQEIQAAEDKAHLQQLSQNVAPEVVKQGGGMLQQQQAAALAPPQAPPAGADQGNSAS